MVSRPFSARESTPWLLLKLVFGHGKGSYCFGSLRKVTRWRQATLRTEGDLLVMHRGRVRRLTCPSNSEA